MAMFKPNHSHSGGVNVNPYTGNIAQELQFLSGEDRKKNQPHCPWQPSKNTGSVTCDPDGQIVSFSDCQAEDQRLSRRECCRLSFFISFFKLD